MKFYKRIVTPLGCFIVGILIILGVTIYYINFTPEGFSQGFNYKGLMYGGERWINNAEVPFYSNTLTWINTTVIPNTLPIEYIHNITAFVKLNRQLALANFGDDAYHGNGKLIVYSETHYADSYPSYDWWFSDGKTIFIYDNWRGIIK